MIESEDRGQRAEGRAWYCDRRRVICLVYKKEEVVYFPEVVVESGQRREGKRMWKMLGGEFVVLTVDLAGEEEDTDMDM
jgi:hypothetical protein